jgi:Mn2+/Fe2+ NRAMP family transporter
MDQVYKKASRVLFVLIFVKNIGVALAWLIGAIFYLPDFTNIPLIICTIIAAGLIALQLCAFGWMSYKVRKSISEQTNMTTNPMLKVVRAKVFP